MKQSESIKEIATALAAAQKVMSGAKKDAENPHFKSKYADLASIWEAARPALTDNGLSVVQAFAISDKDEVVVETRLMHSSGEWLEGSIAVPVTKADAQGYGSAATYARRYSLAAMVGVAPEDDDGNAAAGAAPPKKAAPAKTKMAPNALADWCLAIDAQATMEDLQKTFTQAILQCRELGDEEAEESIKNAKDSRKTTLTKKAA